MCLHEYGCTMRVIVDTRVCRGGCLTVAVTKNQYARDDPAFLVLLSFFLCCKLL
jgi:hypothetical protein